MRDTQDFTIRAMSDDGLGEPRTIRRRQFYLDEFWDGPGFDHGHRWNGWASPLLERAEVEALVDGIARYLGDFPETVVPMSWDEDNVIVHDETGGGEDTVVQPFEYILTEDGVETEVTLWEFDIAWCFSADDAEEVAD